MVAERDGLELDPARPALEFGGGGRVDERGRPPEEPERAAEGGARGLEQRRELDELLDRLEEAGEQQRERDHRADLHLVPVREHGAVADDDRERDRVHELDDCVEARGDAAAPAARAYVASLTSGEGEPLRRLVAVRLDHAHADQRFVHVVEHVGHRLAVAHLHVVGARPVPPARARRAPAGSRAWRG